MKIKNTALLLMTIPALLLCTPTIKLTRLGTKYGGWTIPEKLLNEHSICYCAGAGEDISFDLALIEKYNAYVYTIDPTPRSAHHVEYIYDQVLDGKSAAINHKADQHYTIQPQQLARFEFLPIGLWSENTEIKFFAPQNPNHVLHSILNLQKTTDFFVGECKRLSHVMDELGHTSLDLLKMDIEGAEYAVLDSIIQDGLDIKCLCIEFDELAGVNLAKNSDVAQTRERIQKRINSLEKMGYVKVYSNGYTDMTFVRYDILPGLE